MTGGVLSTSRGFEEAPDLSPRGDDASGLVCVVVRELWGRGTIVDSRLTWIALAIGFALLAIAFALVAQVEDVGLSWGTGVILAVSMVVFLACAVFGIRVARMAFRIWRRADGLPPGGAG